MTRNKNEVHLPGYVREDGFPDGDGPVWIAKAIGAAPGTPIAATAYRSAEDDATAIVLVVGELEITFRPARLVMTRRLLEVLGARGFPTPYYGPPQLALLGQAIGRLAHLAEGQEEDRAADDLAALVGGWARECLLENQSYVLVGRDGRDVRAAIEHVRSGYVQTSTTVPLIVEPERERLLIWTVPIRAVIRDRLGTIHDGDIGVQLQRVGLVRENLAARPGDAGGGTVKLPVWVLVNGWGDVEVEMPADSRDFGPLTLRPVPHRSDPPTHGRAGAHGGDI